MDFSDSTRYDPNRFHRRGEPLSGPFLIEDPCGILQPHGAETVQPFSTVQKILMRLVKLNGSEQICEFSNSSEFHWKLLINNNNNNNM